MSFTFGASKPATSTPLFGSTGASTSTGSLFGSTPATTTTAPAFGAAGTTPLSLGGAKPAPLFGAPAASTAAPLFGATTTAASSLFTTPATTTAASGGLFGAPAATTGGLFGAPAPTPTATTTSVGLGGTTQAAGLTTSVGSGSVLGTTTTEKENVRDGEVPKIIMDLVSAIKNQLNENKTMSDQFAATSSDSSMRVKDRLRELQNSIHEGVGRASSFDQTTTQLSGRAVRDLRLGKEATTTQESRGSITSQQHTVQHIMDLVCEYDSIITNYQEIVEQLTIRLRQMMEGNAGVSVADLKTYLTRFDAIFSSVAGKLFDGNAKVEELRRQLMADGSFIGLTRDLPVQRDLNNTWAQLQGAPAFPSHATLMEIKSMMTPTQTLTATAPTAGGLFGSSTGTSLFGSQPAAKPLFGSTPTVSTGSLFAPTTTTASQSTSLFPSLTTPKTSTGFSSTLSSNASGLLFTGKK